MAKSKTYSSDFSFADLYIDDKRKGKWWRIKTYYPYINDRKAANIDYAADDERRTFRGKVPEVPQDWNKLSVRKPFRYDAAQYLFINPARHIPLPEGYYSTPSGLAPIDFLPFTDGTLTNSPVTVDADFDNSTPSGTWFVAKNINTENMEGETPYYPLTGDGILPGRFEWETFAEDSPASIDGAVRYPLGARRRRFFR